jgi:hypothetical protein
MVKPYLDSNSSDRHTGNLISVEPEDLRQIRHKLEERDLRISWQRAREGKQHPSVSILLQAALSNIKMPLMSSDPLLGGFQTVQPIARR